MLTASNAELAAFLEIMPSQYRILVMARITAALSYVSFNNYWITSSLFSTIAFISFWWFYKQARQRWPFAHPALFAGLFIFPSVVFWSSGISKESLAMACLLGLAAFSFQKLRWKDLPLVMLLVVILWTFRYFYAIIFIPFLITFSLMERDVKNKWVVASAGVLILLTATFLHPNLHLSRIGAVMIAHYHQIAGVSSQENLIPLGEMSTLADMVSSAPKALLHGLTRPWVWEGGSLLKTLAGLETFILMILAAFGVRHFRSWTGKDLMLFAYVMLLLTFLAISVPNIGSLVRYRVAVWWLLSIFASQNIPYLNKLIR